MRPEEVGGECVGGGVRGGECEGDGECEVGGECEGGESVCRGV